MLYSAPGVYTGGTVVLPDAARVLPFGQGTFPLGNGQPWQEARAELQRYREPPPIDEIQGRGARVIPFGQGTFPPGGGVGPQAQQYIVEDSAAYSPYSLILQPFDRMQQVVPAPSMALPSD